MSADPPLFGTPVLDFSSSSHSPSVFHTSAAPPAMPIDPVICPSLDLQSSIQQEINESFVALPVADLYPSEPRFRNAASRAVPVTPKDVAPGSYPVYASVAASPSVGTFGSTPNAEILARPKATFSYAFAKLNAIPRSDVPDGQRSRTPVGTSTTPYGCAYGSCGSYSAAQAESHASSFSVFPSPNVFSSAPPKPDVGTALCGEA